MNRAQQLVQKLVEVGPDDVAPKQELLRNPRPPSNAYLASPEDQASEDWSWRYDLALQLNRLHALSLELKQAGRHEEASDLVELIQRVAEFEDVDATGEEQ